MPRLKRRVEIIWISAALLAGAGGVALATASSSSRTDSGTATGQLAIAAAADPSLASTDPSDDHAMAKLVYATGVAASDAAAAPQTWSVGTTSVLGYAASGGRFCFAFEALGGGCLEPGTLTDAQPIDLTTDYGPGTFHVYGLALDGVTAVSIVVAGEARPAAFAHNAFYFSDDELGGGAGMAGTVVATMGDGSTREAPFRVGSPAQTLPDP